jgi:superfamily II DNA or RNA helicase
MLPKHPKYQIFYNLNFFKNLQSFDDLEKAILNLKSKDHQTNNQWRGNALEVFAEALLATHQAYNIKEVYPNINRAPIDLIDKLNMSHYDVGSDGLYVTKDNKLGSYQVKYRKENKLSWSELSNFIGVSERANERRLITNVVKVSDEFLNKDRVFLTNKSNLQNLTNVSFQKIHKWLGQERAPIQRHFKDGYQKDAIGKILKELKIKDRATTIMACGTGKTLVGLWTYEALRPKISVVFVPSIGLIKQIRADWLEQLKFNVKTISICSSKDRSSREDEIQLDQKDLDFEITTNLKKIKKFVNQKSTDPKIIFCTYQSSLLLGKIFKDRSIDFGIFDEAHRTASLKRLSSKNYSAFNFALSNQNIKIKKRLFMTATRRLSTFKKFNKEGDTQQVMTMDNEKVYGDICYNLSFLKAARLNVIARVKIITTFITSDEAEYEKRKISRTIIKGKNITTEQVAYQLAIKNAVEKNNINKIFSFHSRVHDAKNFTARGPEGIINHLDGFYSNHIEGKTKTKNRENIIHKFKAFDRGILSNARCLVEGVDVPAVEMVAFITPKQSEIDIVQAIGRALRKRKTTKKYGYVLVPIFIEKKKNETTATALKRSNFEKLALVLKALKEHDDEIAQLIDDINISSSRGKGFSERTNKKIKELVEGIHPTISKSILLDIIKSKIVKSLRTHWDEMIGRLLDYKEKYKNCNVPLKWKNDLELGKWVHGVRLRYRAFALEKNFKGRITFGLGSRDLNKYQIKQLNDLNFNWKFDGETLFQKGNLVNEKELNRILGRITSALIKTKYLKAEGYIYTNKLSALYDLNKSKKIFEELNLHNNKLITKSQLINKLATRAKRVNKFIKEKKLIPDGLKYSQGKLIETFFSETIKKFEKEVLGITVDSTKGLVSYTNAYKLYGYGDFGKKVEKGEIDYEKAQGRGGVKKWFKKEIIQKAKLLKEKGYIIKLSKNQTHVHLLKKELGYNEKPFGLLEKFKPVGKAYVKVEKTIQTVKVYLKSDIYNFFKEKGIKKWLTRIEKKHLSTTQIKDKYDLPFGLIYNLINNDIPKSCGQRLNGESIIHYFDKNEYKKFKRFDVKKLTNNKQLENLTSSNKIFLDIKKPVKKEKVYKLIFDGEVQAKYKKRHVLYFDSFNYKKIIKHAQFGL